MISPKNVKRLKRFFLSIIALKRNLIYSWSETRLSYYFNRNYILNSIKTPFNFNLIKKEKFHFIRGSKRKKN